MDAQVPIVGIGVRYSPYMLFQLSEGGQGRGLLQWFTSLLNDSISFPFVIVLGFISVHLFLALVRISSSLSGERVRTQGEQTPVSQALDPGTFYFYLTWWHNTRNGNHNICHTKDHRIWAILSYSVARLVGCLLLLGMSIWSLPGCGEEFGTPCWNRSPEVYMTLTYLYALLLVLISMTVPAWTTYARRFSTTVLFCALAVYVYRDLWPLATYTLHPRDSEREGNLLWVKIFVLSVVSVFIPLFVPRKYVPMDPKESILLPNEEQTCSIASLLFYSFLNPVVSLGYRVEHLTPEQLPPLSDSDHTENLAKTYFPYLDPYNGAKKRHLFFGLMKVFRKEYTFMAISVVGQTIAAYFNPIAINHILKYMETGGVGATVRPWFWVVCLFLGPTLSAIWLQYYLFNSTRILMRARALITQLVFEHSLRIRFVEDVDDGPQGNKQDTGNHVETQHAVDERLLEDLDNTENSSTTVASSSADIPTDALPTTETSETSTKARDKASSPGKDETKAKKDDSHLIGKINSLVTTDLSNIVGAQGFLDLVLGFPLQMILSTFFLYQLLGWSVFIGIALIVLFLPVPGYAASLGQDLQRSRMKKTDARVQDVTEALSILRMIKLFGWEGRMSKRLQEKRNEELDAVWKLQVLGSFTGLANAIIPTISMVATFATYTIIMKKSLTPSTLFSSLTVFAMLRMQLGDVSGQVSAVTRGKVSLDRVTHFLQETELLDTFVDEKVNSEVSAPVAASSVIPKQDALGFKKATFSWYRNAESFRESESGASKHFKIRIDGELLFKPDCINLIVGPTGSGKTSILMALLGEMYFIPSGGDSWFNLPRDQGIAYAAQESWVQSDTIRNNILFGLPHDEHRYRKVLHQCALERDLDLFDAGDATEVGEKGITLSGGQKARVTLARAIYSNAKVVLLDDVLAALDVHTAVWVVEKCLGGDLVKGRTILLVTHNVALLSPIAGFVVSMGPDGTVRAHQGLLKEVLEDSSLRTVQTTTSQEELGMEREEVPEISRQDTSNGNGKLILAEEIARGRISRRAYGLFFSGLGGDHPFILHSLWIFAFLLSDSVKASQTWFLGVWGSQYETHDPSEVPVRFYLLIYTSIIFGMMLLDAGSYLLFVFGTMRASRKINNSLIDSVLTSTLRWLDETPTARIITRCTQDIGVIDGSFSNMFLALSNIAVEMAIKIGVILIFTPLFLIPAFFLVIIGLYLGNIYMKTQLSVKREASNAHAPMLGHFNTAISGIISLRAYGAQIAFINESRRLSDFYLHVNLIVYNLNRWIGIRMSILGSIFTTGLAAYLVYGHSIGSANTGFSLAFAAEFSAAILWWVKFYNEFEIQANSLERIQGYIDIDHEPQSNEEGKPPAAWPTSGSIVVENLSARYSKGGPTILHNISFRLESGQRIGIVGRTRSGKSSLTLALLRGILTEGAVYYDGIPTNKINLDALRSNITIIPQNPELISDTLRKNLDPFDQYDDATLNDALHSAGLFSLRNEEHVPVTLDSKISSGGSNFSVGERQIIALARAIVRGSKLLILDEATSAIDYATDSVIQTTLRKKLPTDVTVITVAHRLQTIMDADKIMVLEDGHMVEFDSPSNLLRREESFFKSLVDKSGDRLSLYAATEK